MIISASRRTDIPAFYSDWFFQRLAAGYVLVRNPMNARQIGRVVLSPDTVDGFVFWTKNPAPMLSRLEELESYPYYFQFTLNDYAPCIEPSVPDAQRVLLPAFRELAKRAGPERIVWRYNPVLFTEEMDAEYHARHFRALSEQLNGCTKICDLSFLTMYAKTERNTRHLGLRQPEAAEKEELVLAMADAAKSCGIRLRICGEPDLLQLPGIEQARCIDADILSSVSGREIRAPKDRNQRQICGCAASIDIGAYDTCAHRCAYCYANARPERAVRNAAAHDPAAEMLIGRPGPEDRIRDRAMPVCTVRQSTMFAEESR